MTMLGGGDSEPLPENNNFLTWARMRPDVVRVDAAPAGFRNKIPLERVPPELMIYGGRCCCSSTCTTQVRLLDKLVCH